MYLTGFADEAADDIDGQIKATKQLGWKYIEARNIDGVNIHDLPDDKFGHLADKLGAASVSVNCFGSTIANWETSINEPFDSSLQKAERAIPRMLQLGTKLIRVMSFAVLDGREPPDQAQQERFRRLRQLQKMFADADLTLVHENCMNYGGMGWPFTLELLQNVPGLKLVFDTANPLFTDDRSKPKPYPKQSTWEFYQNVKDHIAYVHIKDCRFGKNIQKPLYTFPGDGKAEIPRIIADLLKNGYDGGLSIEPHMTAVFHDDSVKSPNEIRYANYIEYGQRLMKIIAETKP